MIHARSEWTRKFLAHNVQCDVNNSIFHRHNTSFSVSSVRVKNIYVLIQNLFDFPSLATLSISSNYFMLKFLKCVEDEEFGIKQFCGLLFGGIFFKVQFIVLFECNVVENIQVNNFLKMSAFSLFVICYEHCNPNVLFLVTSTI